MVKRVFSRPLKSLQGCINFICKLTSYHRHAFIIHILASKLKRLTLRSK
ncbi:hypothetical protein BTN50_0824 [Candidatus Enterovibrio altilux]|uniref:Uncharacterized protein n=1 Tax=Candidatus Enterovibrio altilux TaxID=1927128 RepID=A0A291B8L6_9GAMM|nr:hypothetical protein BTN50_0824 [Candidatus Enterovibrio luxaltus]